jgi:hypothetical protein
MYFGGKKYVSEEADFLMARKPEREQNKDLSRKSLFPARDYGMPENS